MRVSIALAKTIEFWNLCLQRTPTYETATAIN